MTEAWLWLESTAFAVTLRDSVWVYPLINAAHILGVALVVGAIVPLDLRLLGVWPTIPIPYLWPVATRTAVWGFALATTCGVLLFTARASEYAVSPYFQAKMVLLALAGSNAFALRQRMRRHPHGLPTLSNASPRGIRFAALCSILTWISVLVLGRLVGYF